MPDRSLRVLALVSRFPSFSETFILGQLAGLIERGADLSILAFDRGDPPFHPDVEKHRLSDRTRYAVPVTGTPVARAIKGIGLLARFGPKHPALAFRALNPALGRTALSFRLLSLAAPVAELDRRFDVVHAFFGPNGVFAADLLRAGILHGRLLVGFFGYDVSQFPQQWGPGIYRSVFRYADRVLVLSEQMRTEVCALGCTSGKLAVHHLGVDCSQFAFRERQPPPPGTPPRVISICRLVEKKGLAHALGAVAALRRGGVAFEYTIVGEGPLRQALEEQARASGIADCVRFLGARSQPEVSELLDKADIFLCPSVTTADGDREGTPTAIMEAMARGLPVVSTHHAGIPEVVLDGVTGLLAPERDEAALASALRRLAEQPDLWSGFGRAGRQRAEAEFNIAIQNDRLLSIYHELAGR
ncbi:glycosyltransferase [Candidatus Poribacteria bacterium]|nr:glycosyltransferase [Candidatus Poribacteria bacterium]